MLAGNIGTTPLHRLRFVFNHCVLSFYLTEDATYADVGRTMNEQIFERYGKPVGIDVTLTDPRATRSATPGWSSR